MGRREVSDAIRIFYEDSPVASRELRINGFAVGEWMAPCLVDRPRGTGDWLLMAFHQGVDVGFEGDVVRVGGAFLMVWPPRQGHYYGRQDQRWCQSWIHCDGTLVERLVATEQVPTGVPIHGFDHLGIDRCVASMYAEIHRHPDPDATIVGNLLHNVLRDAARSARSAQPSVPPGLLAVRRHIEANFTQRLTLAELASRADCSVPHLCALFSATSRCPRSTSPSACACTCAYTTLGCCCQIAIGAWPRSRRWSDTTMSHTSRGCFTSATVVHQARRDGSPDRKIRQVEPAVAPCRPAARRLRWHLSPANYVARHHGAPHVLRRPRHAPRQPLAAVQGAQPLAQPENPDGAKGRGDCATTGTDAHCAAELGPGWKMSPSIHIEPGATQTIADIDGPGAIQPIWMTPTGMGASPSCASTGTTRNSRRWNARSATSSPAAGENSRN